MWCVFAFLVSVSFQHICGNGDGQQQPAPPRARRGVDFTIKKKKKKFLGVWIRLYSVLQQKKQTCSFRLRNYTFATDYRFFFRF